VAKNDFLESIKKAAESQKRALEEGPVAGTYIAKPKDETGIDPRIIAYHDPKSKTTENYRAIFTHLKPTPEKSDIKTIAVMSASNQEGKSITAVNLSIVIASDYNKKTLLIDANLRRPAIDELLNIEAKEGLSDLLTKDLNYNNVLTQTRVKNLSIMTAGSNTVNPAEVLSTNKIVQFLEEAKQRFDYIILDTSAIIPYADSKIIAPLAEGIILTIRSRRTRREVINRAMTTLDKLSAKVLGFVLTDVEYYIPEFIYKHL
jgi:capsular exopolysaccharide synthesis family protein